MWYDHLHHTVAYLQENPNLGGFIAYLIALSESLAIIGTVIPGSVTMTAIGALVGTGVLPAISTIIWAIMGAFTGDFISYWVGSYYNERLRKIWPFRRYPHLLTLGEAFFKKHGGKSVVIGRFAGPVRSVVPLIAGLLHMPIVRFILAAIPSAILWAIVYMLPGILLGALSLELPPSTATKFIVGSLIFIALLWILLWLLQLCFKTLVTLMHRMMNSLWRYLESHRALRWVTTLLEDPRYPDHSHQLGLAIFAVLSFIIFLIIYINILIHGPLTHLNVPTLELLRSIRNRTSDDIMVVLTILGDKTTLLVFAAAIFIWLLGRKHRWAALHWFLITAGTTILVHVLKSLHFSARPTGVAFADTSSSFPSGHTALSFAFLGFLAVLIARELKPELRRIPYIIAFSLSLLIGLSRLYLGAHWLTDVLGSIFLALTCILVITISYRRKPTQHIPPTAFTIVSVLAFLMIGAGFSVAKFHKVEDQYAPYWPAVSVEMNTWWEHRNPSIPLYVTSRLAKPHLALNIQWLGSFSELKKQLIANGWQEHTPKLSIKKTIYELSGQNKQHHVPLFPTLYQNEAPVLLMTKTGANKEQMTLQFWKTNITVVGSNNPLWLGSVSYYLPKKILNKLPDGKNVFLSALTEFSHDLKNLDTRLVVVPTENQPIIMRKLHWDGVLILIRKKQ